jgi:transposase
MEASSPRDARRLGLRQVNQARHRARCGICSHAERLAIEKAFLYRQMSVAEITKRHGVGHDAIYRHARAMNLLPTRNRTWRAPLESDSHQSLTSPSLEATKTVCRTEVPSTPYARAIFELLGIPASDELLTAVERAGENKAEKENARADAAANDIFVDAALVKIARPPDSWLSWFQAKR